MDRGVRHAQHHDQNGDTVIEYVHAPDAEIAAWGAPAETATHGDVGDPPDYVYVALQEMGEGVVLFGHPASVRAALNRALEFVADVTGGTP